MAEVTFYFDYKSPYTYLAVEPMYQLERDYDVSVLWRPFVLDLAGSFGSVEERSEAQWRKVKYSYMDARRIANERGLIVKGPKKIFDSRLAAVGALYAQKEGVFRPYNDAVFERFFKRELDIEDPAAMAGVLKECGASTDGFDAYRAGEGLEISYEINGEADAAGVFGAPSFVFEDELFFGGDRIDMLRRRLDERQVPRRRAA